MKTKRLLLAVVAAAFLAPGVLRADITGIFTLPAGSDTYVQYNDGGYFGGDSGLVYNETSDRLTVSTISVAYMTMATMSITGTLSVGGTSSHTGAASFGVGTFTGLLTASSSATVTGTLTGSSATFTNTLTGSTATFTGGVTAATVTVTGLLQANAVRAITQVAHGDGALGAPSVAFTSETNGTGLYVSGANNLAVAVNGVRITRFNGSALNMDTGNISMNDGTNGKVLVSSGSASAPSLSYTGDTDTGIFWPTTANNVVVAAGGVPAATFTATGLSLRATSTNDDACTTCVGYSISAATTTFSNVTSSTVWQNGPTITLPAGDWMITGGLVYTLNGATATQVKGVISENSGNTTTDHQLGSTQFDMGPPTSAANISIAIPAFRVSTASSKPMYLKVIGTYSAGTLQYTGKITAWRIR